MAALDYTSLAAMNPLAAELAGSNPTDLDSLLEDSAATHTSATVTAYRPYYVAATILRRVANTRRLRSARGAVFDNPIVTIRGLMRQQASFDANMLDEHADYAVPEGHEASGGSRATVVF